MSDREHRGLSLLFRLMLCGLAGCTTAAGGSQRHLSVGAIQGAGHISPYLDDEVATRGIVTAVAARGFYVQDGGDGDDRTSDALFVYVGRDGTLPRAGDAVAVTGTVSEFIPGGAETGNLSVTRLSQVRIEIVSSANPLPPAIVLGEAGRVPPAEGVIGRSELPVNLQLPEDARLTPFNPERDGIDFYEALEGMRVTIRDPVAIAPTRRHSATSSEAWVLADRGAASVAARTARGGIGVEPERNNRGDQNPERIQIQFDGAIYPGAVPAIAVGDRLADITGVVGYSFGNFEVNATERVQVLHSGLARDTTRLVGSANSITIATYNVENLTPLDRDEDRRALIASQIVHNLMAPDVIGLQEIQDNNGTEGGPDNRGADAALTLGALADAVIAAGGPRYEFIDVAPVPNSSGGAPGGNIRNAFLYNPARVRLRQFTALTPQILAEAGVADDRAFAGARAPLLAVFEFAGREFTVICNHLSSRFGSTPVFGAVQPFVQAAEENREAQVRALHQYVARLLADDAQLPIVVLGDMNTFEFTDDLAEILPGREQPILSNLILRVDEDRYTYNFEGNSQVLDHIFVSRNLLAGAAIDIVHVNVDFPDDGEGVASDHDPVLARLTPVERGL